MNAILPELEQGEQRSPEKALVCEILLLAIVDSRGNAMSLQSGANRQEAAELARLRGDSGVAGREYDRAALAYTRRGATYLAQQVPIRSGG